MGSKMMIVKVIATILITITLCESAKILYVMPFSAKSHYISQKDLPLELARKGHDVYVITAQKETNLPSNYHPILVDDTSFWDANFPIRPNVFSMAEVPFVGLQNLLYSSGYFVSNVILNSTEVKNFLNQDHKFDLVVNELFFQESLYMLAHKYKAPLVLITTFGNSFKANYFGRNPLQLATAYHEYGVNDNPYSFVGRLKNLFFCMYDLYKLKYEYMPKQEEYARQIFKDLPEPLPSLEELASNSALVLMNNHFSIDVPVAYLPNFIEVGSLQVDENVKELPKDLQEILDNASNGVVYLSFGSNVVSTDLSADKFNAFMKVFRSLKQTVLMKWEDESIKNVPKNVIMRKWFPQKDVLAHRNIKLFICHGGLIGLMEAISSGVPIIGVPVYGDQYINLFQAIQKGFGEMIQYKDITKDSLQKVVDKVINDDNYLKRAKEVSKIFKDRPMSGLDTAVWWIEYVIRHKGADFMKTPALKMSFFEANMLDVYMFLFGSLTLAVYLIIQLITLIKAKLSNKKKNISKKKQR